MKPNRDLDSGINSKQFYAKVGGKGYGDEYKIVQVLCRL